MLEFGTQTHLLLSEFSHRHCMVFRSVLRLVILLTDVNFRHQYFDNRFRRLSILFDDLSLSPCLIFLQFWSLRLLLIDGKWLVFTFFIGRDFSSCLLGLDRFRLSLLCTEQIIYFHCLLMSGPEAYFCWESSSVVSVLLASSEVGAQGSFQHTGFECLLWCWHEIPSFLCGMVLS